MDTKTLDALRGSIQKWRDILDGTDQDEGAQNCPLCKEFYDRTNPDDPEDDAECFGCPVRNATGEPACAGSPYKDWMEALDAEADGRTPWSELCRRADTPAKRTAAQAELDFLTSLLPDGTASEPNEEPV